MSKDLTVRRGSSVASRLKSGAGNYRYIPLAKIQLENYKYGLMRGSRLSFHGNF
jgi:hypothetical protein